MKTRWEMQKYTAFTRYYSDIFYDKSFFPYVYGDCEVTDVYDNEEDALDDLFRDNNDVTVTYHDELNEWELSGYAVQWVTYDDLGNYVDEGELIY